MKRPHLIAAIACIVAIAGVSQDAFARGRMYHPGLGRFMQRDPIGTATAHPMARNLSASQFTQRDPTGQYADGPNLYQYVGSNPVNWVDYTGYGKEKPDGGGAAPAPAPAPAAPPAKLQFAEAHFLHSVGTYPHMGQRVGHTGIGCKHKDGTMWVFDHVGYSRYQAQHYKDWLDQEASNCPKGCEYTIEDMLLALTAQQANDFCERLAGKSKKWKDFGLKKIDVDLGWDWQGRGGKHGHNCNSSVCLDMGDTTPIDVPEKPANLWGYLIAADYYNRWGKHTAPWLRDNGYVKSETKSTHKCTGGGSGAGPKK